ncbi:hypothetical protein M3231_02325 [Neobacillus mesonae]|nr:hypothetical protein [Neobacillus mesonae]
MKEYKHYLFIWVIFAALVSTGALAVEMTEGYKITTTEYFGLRNLGLPYLIVIAITVTLPSIAVYPIIFLPLSLLFHRWMKSKWIQHIIMIVIGASFGAWFFYEQYSHYSGYELQVKSSVIIFAFIGLIYSLMERLIKKSAKLAS